MKILLVDDKPSHRRAGKGQLEALGHEVTVVSDYTEARRLGQIQSFDVALLDLLMPAETTTLGPEAIGKYAGVEIDVGFPLMCSLTAAGIRRVAIATDTNHHNHPLSAMVDWFYHTPMTINGAKVLILHCPMCDDQTKNWGKVLELLLSE